MACYSFREMIGMKKLKISEIITETDFRAEVIMSTKPVLVVFVTEWSGACHIIAPVIERTFSDFNGNIDFYCVDVDKNKNIAKTYGIQNVPTLIFFRNGIAEDCIKGAVSGKTLASKLSSMLSGPE